MVVRVTGRPEVDEGGLGVAAGAGSTGKPLTRPEFAYLALAFLFVGVGWLAAVEVDHHVHAAPYHPAEGVSVFAIFYIVAQALERLLEPLTAFYGATTPKATATANVRGLTTKSHAVKQRDMKIRDATRAAGTNAGDTNADSAADWQQIVDQVRSNTTTVWALGAALAMCVSGWLGLLLLRTVGLGSAPRGLDLLVTGLVLGGGTKPLHDLIGNIQKSKEQKENPSEVSGARSGT